MLLHGGVDRIEEKADLVREVRTNPRRVHFYCTNLVGSSWSGPVAEMPAGATLVVWGSDPWRDRRWRVTITRGRDGFLIK